MNPGNRGKHSNDDKLFSKKWQPILSEAVDDLSYLLSRGYAYRSALQIVGNRYKLNKRQRIAVNRISSSHQQTDARKKSSIPASRIINEIIEIDGFNLLISVESALSGGYIFKSRDETYRDISSVHGTYKRVRQTGEAILLIGRALKELRIGQVIWYLDQPVSNSGKLKSLLLTHIPEIGLDWDVELVFTPDKILMSSKNVVVSSDGMILDQVDRWFNLGAYIIDNYIQDANIVKV